MLEVETLTRTWTSKSPYPPVSRPLLVAGDRLLGLANKQVFALNLYTGVEIRVDGGFPCQIHTRHGDPHLAFGHGALYLVDEGKLKAFDIVDGTPLPGWTPPPVATVAGVTALADAVMVTETAGSETTVTAYATGDGSPAWRSGSVELGEESPGEVAYGDGAVFFVAGDRLRAVNVDFGDARWPDGGAAIEGANQTIAPLVDTERQTAVVVGSALYGVDVRSGDERWKIPAVPDAEWLAPALAPAQGLVVAATTSGDVLALRIETGAIFWHAVIPGAGAPTVIGERVHVPADNGAHVHVLQLRADPKELVYDAGESLAQSPTIANATLFLPTTDGNVVAKAFGDETAAYFDGEQAYVEAPPVPVPFLADGASFTVEAWIKTTEGGALVATRGDADRGVQWDVTRDGQLRFLVAAAGAADVDFTRSVPTMATDGEWHHVAVARNESGAVALFVDGVTVKTTSIHRRDGVVSHLDGKAIDHAGRPLRNGLTPVPPPQALTADGHGDLTIGAIVDERGGVSNAFAGLLREVRIWDRDLSAEAIAGRMVKALGAVGDDKGASEQHLLGNWHLDPARGEDIHVGNDVLEANEARAAVHGVKAVVTDLELDMSAFPYHLHQDALAWPYQGHWSVRGEEAVAHLAPAVSSNGVLAFATGNALYGIDRQTGKRLWGLAMPARCSAPVADQTNFYVLSGEHGLLVVDSSTGEMQEADGFASLTEHMDEQRPLTAPAIDDEHVAAAGCDGTIIVHDRSAKDPAQHATFTVGTNPRNLTLAGRRLFVVADAEGGGTHLHAIDLAGDKPQSVAVTGDAVCAAGDWVYCLQDGGVARLDAATLARAAHESLGHDVTGIAVDLQANVLIVTTGDGVVLGRDAASIGERWPSDRVSAAPLGPPALAELEVYCASADGVVVAVDRKTGELRARFELASTVTPPVVAAGTVYVGSSDSGPGERLDGALHSVVVGETRVLRVGLDEHRGRGAGGYARIDADKKTALHLMRITDYCAEAWINTWDGGEILSICPSGAGGYGLRLHVEKGEAGLGRLHVVAREQLDGAWSGYDAVSVPLPLCDGNWHHVAASCVNETVSVYLDGVPQDVVTTSLGDATPQLVVEGLKAHIGADASAETPSNFFAGLIADVRVWDTFLEASEVHDRMHVKLRGTEPDLLAYWNFDTLAVFDGSPWQHNGTRVGNATYWLADLGFEHPTYPYITTSAKQSMNQPSTGASYDLTIGVYAADGTPLDGHELELWYVKADGETGPATVNVADKANAADLPAVAPGDEQHAAASFQTKTHLGEATLTVQTSDKAHGPRLDLHAQFMPANERFHVNVLIDGQSLPRPAPPTLLAQTKLIQDYHWSPGNKLSGDRSRETYRTVIQARNSDHSPRPSERIQVWATDHISIEHDGVAYPVSPNDSQTFSADATGELTLVVAATDLKVADLQLCAGFMNRNDRITVTIEEDAHARLASVQGHELKDPERMKNWRPTEEGGPERGALLKGDYGDHADDVAAGVRHVSSAAAPASDRPKTLRGPGLGARAVALGIEIKPEDMSHMRQLPTPARADVARARRGPVDQARPVPVALAAMRESLALAKEPGAEAAPVGFVIGLDDNGRFVADHFTADEADKHMGRLDPRPLRATPPLGAELLGLSWGDIVDTVSNVVDTVEAAAQRAWEEAKRIAIEVADKVNVALHYAGEVVMLTVNSIAEAMEVVANFFVKLALAILDVIKFLLFLFDWDAIKATHNILQACLTASVDSLKAALGEVGTSVGTMLKGLETELAEAFGKMPAEQNRSLQDRQEETAAQAQSADSVQGKMLTDKTRQHTGNFELPLDDSEPALDDGDIMLTLIELAPRLAGLGVAELGAAMLDLVGDTAKLAAEIESELAKVAKQLDKALNPLGTVISIPFLSQLYEWVMGEPLTVGSLTTFGLAIPVNLTYGVVCAAAGQGLRHFNEDMHDLPSLLGPSGLRALHILDAPAVFAPENEGLYDATSYSSTWQLPVPAGATTATVSLRRVLDELDWNGSAFSSEGEHTFTVGSPFEWAGPPADAFTPAEAYDVHIVPDVGEAITISFAWDFDPTPWKRPSSVDIERTVIAMRYLATAFGLATDAMFYESSFDPGTLFVRNLANIAKGIVQMIASTLLFVCSFPAYLQRIKEEMARRGTLHELAVRKDTFGFWEMPGYYTWMLSLTFVGDFGGALAAAAGGAYGLYSPAAFPRWPGTIDRVQYQFFRLRMPVYLLLIAFRVYQMTQAPEYRENGVGSDAATAGILFGTRDITRWLAGLFDKMFTQSYRVGPGRANTASSWEAAGLARVVLNTGSTVLHGVAESKLGNL